MRVGFSLDVASWFSCVLRSSGKGGKAGEATHKKLSLESAWKKAQTLSPTGLFDGPWIQA